MNDPAGALTNPDLGGRFSAAQATAFVTRWSVVDQYDNSALFGLLGTGFSATVFESLDNPGQYTFAIRGTNFPTPSDLGADLSLASGGVAFDQALDMVNYLLRLQAGSSGVTRQVELLAGETAPSLTSGFVSGIGSGVTTAQLTVVGHSLGGYLGMVFQRIFGGGSNGLSTFNAPGFVLSDYPVFDQLASLLGLPANTMASVQGTNLVVPGDSISGWGAAPGGRQNIFSETENSATPFAAHDKGAITDSLALYNLFATLDPALNVSPGGLDTLTAILKASSNVADRSLETTLDALGKLFGQTFTTATDNRESFYANLNQMQALFNPAFSVAYTVESLADRSAATLAAQAQSSLAARYALVAGNAFAVTGANYGAFNPNGELDLYDPDTGTGHLTDQYLKDRAAYLANRNAAYAGDQYLNGAGYVISDGALQHFVDGASGDIFVAPSTVGYVADDFAHVAFGAITADILAGGAKDDHLYGMGGDDTLTGGAGSDYLEGGQGADTYLWNTGDGPDTILDTDGQGSIVLDGQTLAGGESRDGGRTWQSGDGGHTYAVLSGDVNGAQGATLLVDGNLTVQHYRADDLGLALAGAAPAAAPATTRDIFGDLAPDGTPDDLGNPDGAAAPGRSDWLYDSAGNDLIQSGGGNDIVDAWHGGDDRIELGSGDDATMFNNGGDDIVIGGDGRDVLLGGDGRDRLYAREEATVAAALAAENLAPGNLREFLDGGAGDDTLIGGTGGDALIGGQGSDLILAGAGDDDISADLEISDMLLFNWNVQRGVTAGNTYLTTYSGITYTQPVSGGNDVIHAGAGNDWVHGGYGNDHADGGTGDDVIFGQSGSDVLLGGAGQDILYGDTTESNSSAATPGCDYLDGGAGADTIYGNEGDDVIAGGTENDALYGGAGNDTYLYNAGDGSEQITEAIAAGAINTLLLGAGITPDHLKLRIESTGYVLALADGQTISLMGGAAGFINAQGNYTFDAGHTDIGQLQFADGGSLSWEDFLKRGLDQRGATPVATVLGSNYGDRLSGAGATLNGGAGGDTYLYRAGDGAVHIKDALIAGDTNTLRFGAGISSGQIKLGLGSLKLDLGNGDVIHIDSFNPGDALNSATVQRFEFADGTALTTAELLARGFDLDGTDGADTLTGTNTADRINGYGGNDTITGGDGGDTLDGGAGADAMLGGAGNCHVNSKLRTTTRRARPSLPRPALPLAA